MLWPNGTTTKPYITSPFGPRNLPNPNASKYHRGADMVGFREVKAIESGQVKVTGTPSGWSGGGTQVWLQHDGYFSRSLHLASYSVRNGQFVRAGETIGIMGTTPHVDLHLHLEISPGNVHYSNTGQVDPVAFISQRLGGFPAGGGSTTPEDGFLMGLSDYDQQLVKNAVVDINNRTADMAAAMKAADAQVAALYALYASRDENGWSFKDIVQSHVVATLAELRNSGVVKGDVDEDALARKIVDETARRLSEKAPTGD